MTYTKSAIDINKKQVKYTFDVGDGTTSVTSLVNSGTKASASHSWCKAGTFQVNCQGYRQYECVLRMVKPHCVLK